MSPIEVRPFRRADRDQLTDLVNAHAAAVVPGMSVSVNAVLSQLEREPAEFIVDPWVTERVTLVAEQRGRIAAAAHLLRYADADEVSDSYRGSAEIRWLLFWPRVPDGGNPHWPDAAPAAERLMAACLAQLRAWNPAALHADGALPAPGVFGVPEQWPHIAGLYRRSGFRHEGGTLVVYLARTGRLPRPGAPDRGLAAERSVGINGTRISARLGAETIGYIEVDTLIGADRQPRRGGWADIGNLHVAPAWRRRGVGSWLLGLTADWLELAQVPRLLDYAEAGGDAEGAAAYRSFLARAGFTELTRSRRGWVRQPRDPALPG